MKRLIAPYRLTQKEFATIAEFLPTPEPILTGPRRIPVCETDVSKKEKRYIMDAVDSSWFSSDGPYVKKFEQAFAQNVSKTKYACAVNSGTSGLHLALVACGIGLGDEVIVPTFTMIASANAIVFCQATPVLVDADPATWNMDVSSIEGKITKKTRAIMVVHIYGSPVDMDPIFKLARKYNLWVIEDAAEAHGAEYKGRRAGSLGDVAVFSMYANKVITTGEGGVVTTSNAKLASIIRLLRDQAFSGSRHFWHTFIAYNYRMGNLQAALGLAQVERFDLLVEKRRQHAALYAKLLKGIPGITLPVESPDTKNVFWMYGLCIDKKRFGVSKDELRVLLAAKGIETRSFFIPIHFQPPYYHAYKREHYPVANRLCRDGLYLPSASTLTENMLTYICDQIRRCSA